MTKEVIVDSEQVSEQLSRKAMGIILIHAFIGWGLCTATMVISMATTTIENALIIHAIGAPIIFTGVSLVYFNRFNYTRPLWTAVFFVSFVILMDFFVVSLLVLRNFDMFTSLLGTWIPFTLIFISTYLTGLITLRKKEARSAS